MPNHFTTYVRLVGPHDAIEALTRWLEGPEEVFDVSTIIPMPPELCAAKSGLSRMADGTELREWVDTPDGPAPVPDAEALRKRYGAANSYDASRLLWGSKWASYSSEMLREPRGYGDNDLVVYRYDSAWCPCYVAHALIDAVCQEMGASLTSVGHDDGESIFELAPVHGDDFEAKYMPDGTWARIAEYFGDDVLRRVREALEV